jgi:hypothetical protein
MNKIICWFFSLVLLFVVISPCYAGEVATFESFYTESSSWLGFGLALIGAVIIGAIVFFTGGASSPLVAGPAATIGTYIGTFLGYSGVVATNVGLALLGGGAIAAGGLGMAGGAALLTAVLTFGTEIVLDYTVNKISTAYSQAQFVEQSKQMTTLPLPINTDGPDVYEEAMEQLKQIDTQAPYSSPHNQNLIGAAFQKVRISNFEKLNDKERIQLYTFAALLAMLKNDYVEAKTWADRAIGLARNVQVKRTLPALIYAASSLYEPGIDISIITQNYFNYAILAEPDNPIIPLMFAVYLDRIMYRFNDGLAKEQHLRELVDIASRKEIGKQATLSLILIAVRYFTRLKLEQQAISSLSTTQNMTVKNSPKTLTTVKDSLASYGKLLIGTNRVLENLTSLPLEKEDKQKSQEFWNLYSQYERDKTRLDSMVADLENYQNSLQSKGYDTTDMTQSNYPLFIGGTLLLSVLVVLGLRKFR